MGFTGRRRTSGTIGGMSTSPRGCAAILTAALCLIPAASAAAAPRLTSVSTPPPVPGGIVPGIFPTCGAVGPVPLSFTASQAGTALVTKVQTWPISFLGVIPTLDRVTFRAGANTIDLRKWSGGIPGTDRGPTRMTATITLLPVNARWQAGPAVTRAVSITCT